MPFKDIAKRRAYAKEYERVHYGIGLHKIRGTTAGRGQAAEFFVAADLLLRGMEVTKPLDPTTKHDLHAQGAGKWHNFQVKSGRFNRNTGRVVIRGQKGGRPASDILAVVDVRARVIEYTPLTMKQLPKELRHADL